MFGTCDEVREELGKRIAELEERVIYLTDYLAGNLPLEQLAKEMRATKEMIPRYDFESLADVVEWYESGGGDDV